MRPPHESRWHTLLDRTKIRIRARRHFRRRVVLAVVVILAALVVGGYRYVTSDRQVEDLAAGYLSEMFHAKVKMHSAHFTFFGGIVLRSLHIYHENQPADEPSILEAEEVRLAHDPLALLAGRLDVREIVAISPSINLEERDGVWNFQSLLAAQPSGEGGSRQQRPVIYAEDGAVRVRQVVAGQVKYEHVLKLSGIVQPDSARSGQFRFFASDLTTGGQHGLHGSITGGTLDAARRSITFEGRATNVQLSEELAATLPPEARQIYQRFKPRGHMGVKVTFGSDPAAGGEIDLGLEADLNGVSLAYEHAGRKFHFDNLTGQCLVSRRGLRLLGVHGVIASAGGETEGPRVEVVGGIDGWITGLDQAETGEDLTITLDDLDLGRVRPLAAELSPEAADVYTSLQPAGRVDVTVHLVRDALPGAQTRVSGLARLRDGRCTPIWFPFPVEDLSGTISIEPLRMEVQGLHGRHGGAEIAVTRGLVLNSGPQAEVHFTVAARNITLGAEAHQALAPQLPTALAVYDSLHPEGTADVNLTIDRPAGGEADVAAEILLHGATFKYDGFPYLMTDGVGRIAVCGDRTTVTASGRHGSAALTISGAIVSVKDGSQVDLEVGGRGVGLDDDLAAALPADQRAVYRSYHPSGRADITTKIHVGPETKWDVVHDTSIDLRGAGITFEDFPYPVGGLWGHMEIRPDVFILKDIHGTNAEAALSATGRIERRGKDYSLDLTIAGQNVLLDRNLKGALALQSRQLWADLQPEGRIDLQCHLTRELGQTAMKKDMLLTARDLSLTYRYFPYPIRHAKGEIRIAGNRATLKNLVARDGESLLAASGTIEASPEGGLRSRLALRAEGVELGDEFVRALPDGIRQMVAGLAPRGRLNVNLPDFTYDVDAKGNPTAGWQGSAVLDGGELALGQVTLDRLVAYARIAGSYAEGQASQTCSLEALQGRAAGQQFSNLRAELSQARGSKLLMLKNLEGDLYGGRFQGQGELGLGPAAHYQLAVQVKDVHFDRFARESLGLTRTDLKGGLMSGEFVLRGSGPKVAEADAWATLHITNAVFAQLPGFTQMLNTLRFHGDEKTFTAADLTLLVRKSGCLVEDLSIRGQGLTLRGTGRIDSSGKIDLLFTSGEKSKGGPLEALAELEAGLSRELVAIEVTGTLNDPQVKSESFKDLKAPFRELMAAIEKGRAARAKKDAQK